MLFSGLTFLYCFLPAVLIAYFLAPKGWKNAVLLVFSLVFYAWGEPKYVLLMAATIAGFYFCGLGIGKGKTPRVRKCWLIVSVLLGVGTLGIFKYADFFIGSFNAVTGLGLPALRLALPIGISFYTFQCISYTVDVYRGRAQPQKNIISFGAYVCLFPQLIAGPIVRYTDVARALEQREHHWEDFVLGLRRFLFGLGKKVLLANQFGELTESFLFTIFILGIVLGVSALTPKLAWELEKLKYSVSVESSEKASPSGFWLAFRKITVYGGAGLVLVMFAFAVYAVLRLYSI